MLPARDFAASARGYAQINHGRSDTRDLSLTDALALFSFLLRQWLARCLLRRRTQCPRDHRRRLRSNGRWSRRNFLPVPVFSRRSRRREASRRSFHRNQSSFGLSPEGQAFRRAIPINRKNVAQLNLVRRQQACQRIDQMPLDRALQMPRAVLHVRTFFQQKFTRRLRYAEKELPLRRFENALLHHTQLDIENHFELRLAQWMENHHFVEAVHKFR